jgi:hypothetical protein
MAYFNYTKRVEITCNGEFGKSDVIVYVRSKRNDVIIFLEDLARIKKEIKKNFADIPFNKINIFLEAYRDAFRKEINLGNLENFKSDRVTAFNPRKVVLNETLDRELDEIDFSTVRFRMLMTNDELNLAASEGFRPIICNTTEDIIKKEVIRATSLIAVYEEKMEKLYYADFHNEGKSTGVPTVYLNEKLKIKEDISSDKRLLTIIFSASFEELLKKSLINNDNKYKKRLIDYAQTFNETISAQDILDKIEDQTVSDFFSDSDVKEFIDNATEGYIRQFMFIDKYQLEKDKLLEDLEVGVDDEG